jgi:hypothetical protein
MEPEGTGFQLAIANRIKPKHRRKAIKPRLPLSQFFMNTSDWWNGNRPPFSRHA